MEINFFAVLAAALSSFVVGFIWYNPKVFGTIWMTEIGMTDKQFNGFIRFLIDDLKEVREEKDVDKKNRKIEK